MSAIDRKLTVSASTKRQVWASGLRAAPTTNLASIAVSVLMPVDPKLRSLLQIDTPHEVKMVVCDGSLDIMEGDVLVIGSDEYPIDSVAEWPWPRGGSYHVMIVIENKI